MRRFRTAGLTAGLVLVLAKGTCQGVAAPEKVGPPAAADTVSKTQKAINDHEEWLRETKLANALSRYKTEMDLTDRVARKAGTTIYLKVDSELRIATDVGYILADACDKAAADRPVSKGRRLDLRGKTAGIAIEDFGDEFKGRDLRCASFTGVSPGMNFSGTNLQGAHFSDSADFGNGNFGGANLLGADLENAILDGACLNGADLRNARLRNTSLRGVSLAGAVADGADFSGAFLEPASVENFSPIGVVGLSKIQFSKPFEVVRLRKAMKESGLSQESRALSSALRQYQLNRGPALTFAFEKWILGGALTDFGTEPGASIRWLFRLIGVFAVVYAIAILSDGAAGIFLVVTRLANGKEEKIRIPVGRLAPYYSPAAIAAAYASREGPVSSDGAELTRGAAIPLDASPDGAGVSASIGDEGGGELRRRLRSDTPAGMTRYLRMGKIALQFSLFAAFELGWKDLTVGSWLARLQTREYSFSARGWVRSVAGLQSLLSAYLVALAALTYFQSPFE